MPDDQFHSLDFFQMLDHTQGDASLIADDQYKKISMMSKIQKMNQDVASGSIDPSQINAKRLKAISKLGSSIGNLPGLNDSAQKTLTNYVKYIETSMTVMSKTGKAVNKAQESVKKSLKQASSVKAPSTAGKDLYREAEKVVKAQEKSAANMGQLAKARAKYNSLSTPEKIFRKELKLIQDKQIRQMTVEGLKKAPAYFWENPASSSGKHHQEWSRGRGGLVQHTRDMMQTIGKSNVPGTPLFNQGLGKLAGKQKDIALMGAAFHDLSKYQAGTKDKTTGWEMYDPAHDKKVFSDVLPKDYRKQLLQTLGRKDYVALNRGVRYHMAKKGLEGVTAKDDSFRQGTDIAKAISYSDGYSAGSPHGSPGREKINDVIMGRVDRKIDDAVQATTASDMNKGSAKYGTRTQALKTGLANKWSEALQQGPAAPHAVRNDLARYGLPFTTGDSAIGDLMKYQGNLRGMREDGKQTSNIRDYFKSTHDALKTGADPWKAIDPDLIKSYYLNPDIVKRAADQLKNSKNKDAQRDGHTMTAVSNRMDTMLKDVVASSMTKGGRENVIGGLKQIDDMTKSVSKMETQNAQRIIEQAKATSAAKKAPGMMADMQYGSYMANRHPALAQIQQVYDIKSPQVLMEHAKAIKYATSAERDILKLEEQKLRIQNMQRYGRPTAPAASYGGGDSGGGSRSGGGGSGGGNAGSGAGYMYNAKNMLWGVAGPLLGFQSIVGVLNMSAEAIKNNELALINLRRVFDGTQTDFKMLATELTDFSIQYGDSLENVGKIQEEWAKVGKNTYADISSLTGVTELALNTSDLTNAADAVKYLNSSLIQMELPATKALDLLDSWNKTADKFPADTKDFADAYQRAASYAKNVGLDYNQLNGIISILIERTGRSGEEIGTALRSIFSNIFKPKSIKTLEGLGIQMYELGEDGQKLTNKFRDFPAIVADAAKAFDKFQSEGATAKTVELTRSLGETWRRNFAIALLEGWNSFDKVTAISAESEGYSMKKNEMTMESLAKKSQQLKAALAETAVSVGEAGILGALKNVTGGATDALTGFNNLDPGVRDLITTFLGLQAAMFAVNKGFKILTGDSMGLISKMGASLATLFTGTGSSGGFLANKVAAEAAAMLQLKGIYASEAEAMTAVKAAMVEQGLMQSTTTAGTVANTAATEANTAAQAANAEANVAEAATETVNTEATVANTAADVANAEANVAESAAEVTNAAAKDANTVATETQMAVEKAAIATKQALAFWSGLVVTALILLVYWIATYKKHTAEQIEKEMQEYRAMQQKRVEVDATIKKYNEATKAVDTLNASIEKLNQSPGTNAQDMLKQKTEQLTKANEDLEQVQIDLAKVLPAATTKFNEQGQAMATNIELANRLAEAQKKGADLANEALAAKYKVSKEETEKELADLVKKRQAEIDNINYLSKLDGEKKKGMPGFLGKTTELHAETATWDTPTQIGQMGWGGTFNMFNKQFWTNNDEYMRTTAIEHSSKAIQDMSKDIEALEGSLGQGQQAYDELILAQAREQGKLRASKKDTQEYMDVLNQANQVIASSQSDAGNAEEEFGKNVDRVEKYISVVARSKNHFSDSYRTAIKELTDSIPELARVAASEGKEVGELGADRIQEITNAELEIMREGSIKKQKEWQTETEALIKNIEVRLKALDEERKAWEARLEGNKKVQASQKKFYDFTKTPEQNKKIMNGGSANDPLWDLPGMQSMRESMQRTLDNDPQWQAYLKQINGPTEEEKAIANDAIAKIDAETKEQAKALDQLRSAYDNSKDVLASLMVNVPGIDSADVSGSNNKYKALERILRTVDYMLKGVSERVSTLDKLWKDDADNVSYLTAKKAALIAESAVLKDAISKLTGQMKKLNRQADDDAEKWYELDSKVSDYTGKLLENIQAQEDLDKLNMTRELDKVQKTLDGLTNSYERYSIQIKHGSQSMEAADFKMKYYLNTVAQLAKKDKILKAEVARVTEEIEKCGKLSKTAGTAIEKAFYKTQAITLKEYLKELNSQIATNQKELAVTDKDMQSYITETLKNGYQKQLDLINEKIDKQIKLEQKRHNDFVKNKEKEMKLLDEQFAEDDYKDKIAEYDKQIGTLTTKIASLRGDSSQYAAKMRKDLQKQLDDIEKQKNDAIIAKNREDQKKKIQDEIDADTEGSDKKIELMEHDKEVAAEYYQGLIDNAEAYGLGLFDAYKKTQIDIIDFLWSKVPEYKLVAEAFAKAYQEGLNLQAPIPPTEVAGQYGIPAQDYQDMVQNGNVWNWDVANGIDPNKDPAAQQAHDDNEKIREDNGLAPGTYPTIVPVTETPPITKPVPSSTDSIPPGWNPDDYKADYSKEINRLKAINPNDPRIPILEQARKAKIAAMSDDELKKAGIDRNGNPLVPAAPTKPPATPTKPPATPTKPPATPPATVPATSDKPKDGKYEVGDEVIANGYVYASSDGGGKGTKLDNKKLKVTHVNYAAWATKPVHVGTYGWMAVGDVKSTVSTPSTSSDKPTATPAAPATQTITIKSGDTLTGLAKTYKTTISKLVELNHIADPDKIYAGQKLIVPKFLKGGIMETAGLAHLEAKEMALPDKYVNILDSLEDLGNFIKLPNFQIPGMGTQVVNNNKIDVKEGLHIENAYIQDKTTYADIEEEAGKALKASLFRKGVRL